MPSLFRPRIWTIATGTLLLSAVPAAAQTNGTWSITGGGSWGTATNWQGGSIPDGGGTATLNNLLGLLGNSTVTIDAATSRSVSQVIYDTGYSFTIAGGAGATLNVAAGGLTLNAVNSLISSPTTYFTTTNNVSAVIAGSGDVIKTGNGFVALSGANTFTGTVRINQGTLWNNGTDASFGNAANGVVFDGGALGVNAAGGITTNRAFTVNSGGGTLRTFTALTLGPTSVLTGSGTLTKQIGNANFTIQGDGSGFTGEIRAEGGAVILSSTATSNGRVGGSAVIDVASTLTVDNTTANFANRLNGRPILARGGNVNLTGGASGAAVENAGTLTLAQGNTFVTVTSAGTSTATLSFTGLVRQNNAVAFFRGNNLNLDMLENTGRVVFTSSPGTLIGGGGDPNTSTTASILPFVHGNTSATLTNDSTFLTWNSTTGRLVPVNVATGYATNILAAAAQDNVNQNTSAALAAPTTVNALRMAPTAATTISGTDQLTVTSGAILQTATTAQVATISAPLTAGGQELVVISTSGTAASATPTGLILSGVISGTGGLTRSGGGGVTITGANTYTGTTTVSGGTTVVGGAGLTLTADGSAASVFGQDTSALNIVGTGTTTRLWTTGHLVVNRPLNVALGGQSVTGIGVANLSAGESVTVNGNVTLTNPNGSSINGFFELGGGDTRPEAVTINGNISGSGGLRGLTGGYSVLNGNNTYSGGTHTGASAITTGSGITTQVVNETWEAGSDTAFGTGPIWVQSVTSAAPSPVTTSATLVAGGGPRTITNPIYMVNGFLAVGGNNPLTLAGPVELNGGAQNDSVITVGANSPLTISGQVARGALIKNGAGTLTLTNASNPYSGRTTIRQGVLSVGTIGNGGVAGNMGGGLVSAQHLIISGNAIGDTGTLRYTGAGETTNRSFGLAGTGGTLDASGSGAITFSNVGTMTMFAPPATLTVTVATGSGTIAVSTVTAAQLVVGSSVTGTGIPAGTTITEVGVNYFRLSAAATAAGTSVTVAYPAALTARTLTLTGTNTGLNTLFPVLANGASINLAVAKTGTGNWALTGNNTYSAGTTISGGTLYANNGIATSSATGTGAVAVNAGGTLGGSGFVGGATTVSSGGTIRGGVNNGSTIDNLTVANTVTVNGGGQFGADLANLSAGPGSYTRDRLIVDGAGRSLNFVTTSSAFNIALVNDAGLTNGAAYTLTIAAATNGATITENGGVADFAYLTDFTLSSTAFSDFLSVSLLVNGSNLDLTFTPVPEPGTVFAVGAIGLAAAGWLRRRRTAKAA